MDLDVHIIENKDIIFPKRAYDSHKTDYGKILIVGGSVGYAGAIKMAASASLRAGAGLVSLAVPQGIYLPVAAAMTEAMVFPFSSDEKSGCFSVDAIGGIREKAFNCDVLILGPGLGRSPAIQSLVEELLHTFHGRIILDADGLYALSQIDLQQFAFASNSIVVTPHYGEFSRLVQSERMEDPLKSALNYSMLSGFITVLKGPDTIIAYPNGRVAISQKGNPGMATGGSGDVLAGLIGGFAGQLELDRAVLNGVYIHGMAGDMAASDLGEYSMLPTDLISKIPLAIKKFVNQ